MKGIAYPVQTYEVLGLADEIKTRQQRVKKELEGFRLLIGFQKLTYTDKLAAKEILESAFSRLT